MNLEVLESVNRGLGETFETTFNLSRFWKQLANCARCILGTNKGAGRDNGVALSMECENTSIQGLTVFCL